MTFITVSSRSRHTHGSSDTMPWNDWEDWRMSDAEAPGNAGVRIPGALRATRQRLAVAAALDDEAAFRSAQSLHEAIRGRGVRVGLTTVYRTLQALADAGEVDVIQRADGESVYRRCAVTEHHHHLVCRMCGTTVDVEAPAVERWAVKVAKQHEFTEVSHSTEIFGVCPRCGAQ
ncbi:MAG: Fur family transcriptional regulator [Candidatus Nanopelagicales bacterium]|nr:Fur family transcriptional regulator [Candidatus Nanopelagicales bacterium]